MYAERKPYKYRHYRLKGNTNMSEHAHLQPHETEKESKKNVRGEKSYPIKELK